MKHYVYRITNIRLNKHYYGVRTSKNKTPEEDIGIYYFSSSTDKDFIKDQKENPQDYKYKVIKKFNTREEAIELEIKLHNKFNVGINESFYNKTKQTSVGFDRSGIPTIFTKKHKENLSAAGKNRIFTKKHKENLSVAKLNKYNGENNPMYGKHHSEETKEKIRKTQLGKIISEETRANMRKASKNKITPVYKRIKCPHCDKKGIISNMKRWHFDNCKLK